MNVSRAFGLVLKQLRTKAELTQEELAAKSGYSREFISMLELGKRQPSLTTTFDLATTFGMSGTEFVKRVERRLR